jgi:hypothetical protein
MASGPAGANMLAMNRPSQSSIDSSSRRFLLLPEEALEAPGARPQIRRYRLASIGRGGGLSGTDLAMAQLAGELGRLRRAHG